MTVATRDRLQEVVLERDGPLCYLCDQEGVFNGGLVNPCSLELDRLLPGRFDGQYIEENCRIAHRRCNNQRQNDPPWQWKGLTVAQRGQPDRRKQLLVRVRPEVHEAIQVTARVSGRTVNSIVQDAIHEYLVQVGGYQTTQALNGWSGGDRFPSTAVESSSNQTFIDSMHSTAERVLSRSNYSTTSSLGVQTSVSTSYFSTPDTQLCVTIPVVSGYVPTAGEVLSKAEQAIAQLSGKDPA